MIKINDDLKKLVNEFKRISNKKWIKNNYKSFGAVGNTFEKELGKNADSTYFPDYYGIEIKCTSKFSKYPLYLFTVAFDGPTFPEIERIVSNYGWPDKDYKDKKVIFTKLFFKDKIVVNKKYKFKLYLNISEQKIYLKVYDLNNKLIDDKSFIYLDSIYNHLYLKLKTLAIIHAYTKKLNGVNYFRYYSIDIYNLMDFDTFLYLLKNDDIQIDLISRLNKSGVDAGRYRNKNLVFSIRKESIEKLFKKIYSYNNDISNDFQILN